MSYHRLQHYENSLQIVLSDIGVRGSLSPHVYIIGIKSQLFLLRMWMIQYQIYLLHVFCSRELCIACRFIPTVHVDCFNINICPKEVTVILNDIVMIYIHPLYSNLVSDT